MNSHISLHFTSTNHTNPSEEKLIIIYHNLTFSRYSKIHKWKSIEKRVWMRVKLIGRVEQKTHFSMHLYLGTLDGLK